MCMSNYELQICIFLVFQVSNETFKHSRMDFLSVRFPHLAANILNELDNQSLLKCKEASRQLDQFVETERLIWKRMMDNFTHLIFGQKWTLRRMCRLKWNTTNRNFVSRRRPVFWQFIFYCCLESNRYSSDKIKKAQNGHLIIVCQNLNFN